MNQKLREMEHGGEKERNVEDHESDRTKVPEAERDEDSENREDKGSDISKQTKDDEVAAEEKKKFQIKIKTKTIVKLVLWRMRIKQLWKKVTLK